MRRQLRVVQHPRLQLAGAASSQHSRDAPPDSVRGPGGRTLSGQWPLQRSPSVAGCPQSASPRSAKHRQTPAYLLRRLPAGTRKNLEPSPRCLSGFCRLAVAGERCLGAARIFGAPLSSPQPALRSLPLNGPDLRIDQVPYPPSWGRAPQPTLASVVGQHCPTTLARVG